MNTKEKDLSDQIELLTSERDELAQKNADNGNVIKKLKNDIQKATLQLAEANSKNENIESEVEKKYIDEANRLRENYQKEIEKIQNQSEEFKKAVAQFQTQINDLTEQNERLRRVVNNQKSTISSKDKELQIQKKQNVNNEKVANEKLNEAKAQITASFEKTIKKLSEDYEQQKGDVEKLAKDLALSEGKTLQLTSLLEQAKVDKQRLIRELKSKKEETDREKQLAESFAKAQIISNQVSTSKNLEENKRQFEEKKRMLISSVIDAFKQFSSPLDRIDERTFKNILDKAKNEMKRLTDSDTAIRRMVNVSDSQTTEDAIAQLLFKINQHY